MAVCTDLLYRPYIYTGNAGCDVSRHVGITVLNISLLKGGLNLVNPKIEFLFYSNPVSNDGSDQMESPPSITVTTHED